MEGAGVTGAAVQHAAAKREIIPAKETAEGGRER